LAERRSVKFTDILDRDFVGLDRTSALEGFLRDRAARLGRKMRLRVQLRSFDAVCLMVSAGVGIGIVPETTARRLMGNLAIRTVLLEDNWALRDLRICMQDQLSLSPSAKRLITYLCAADPKAQT
jgi:DNA-binding transcriptional LysR family regulator